MSVSVLVPVYNEEKTVGIILSKLVSLPFVTEIIVIDDCSKDNSFYEITSVSSPKIRVFKLEKNSGKTNAIKKAIKEATGEILIIQDADLEYDPMEIESVIEPILNNHADVVYGSRFIVKKTMRVLYFYHYLANKSLTFLSNMLTNLNMTDIETCYKAFRSPILKYMNLSSKGFGMEVEITAMISKLPIRIYEVPISYYGRTYEEGKKIGLKDGLMAIWYIFYFNIIAPFKKSNKDYFDKVREKLKNSTR
ncbi:MAG: glycosyltransferase family 2 protein [Leptospiraceae bacterium]|nr:glycosyltransferase family 2 protein [Leptospiraceae bacterium]MCP5494624.1 glycosyltransferase family 2 protein [Leptospiraceae bacterium]